MKPGYVIYIHVILLLLLNTIYSQPDGNNKLFLYPESIMRLTMDNSSKIKAAKHKLESAEYNFKLFESEFTSREQIHGCHKRF